MVLPADYTLTIYQGDTFSRNFQVVRQTPTGEEPFDFTEYVPLAQVRFRPDDTEIIAEFDVTYVDQEQGIVNLFMGDDQSRLLPRVSFYDFQTRDDVTGDVKTWFGGRLQSPREVSRDYNGD